MEIVQTKRQVSLVKMAAFSILLACGYFFGALMYTPSLPAITSYFDVNSSLSRMTISSFLLVLSVSQLIYGPASDKYGRKPVILFGAMMFLIGSMICTFSVSIDMLIIGRGVQGLGAGALIILARTIVQDSVSKEEFLQVIAWMSIFFSMAPAISPLIGGILQNDFGWHGNFAFMVLFAIILVGIVYFKLHETIDEKNPNALNVKHLTVNYISILKNKLFLVYMVCIVVSLSSAVIFDAIGSFILIDHYGFSAFNFGVISTLLLAFIVLSRIISSFILMRFLNSDMVIVVGLTLMLISSLVLVILTSITSYSVAVFITIMAVYYLGSGFVLPIAGASALNLFSKNKGAVSAIYGALQMGGVFLMSFIAALTLPTLMHLSLILVISSVVSFIFGAAYLYPKARNGYRK
ncbi:Bcr/CflA family efflux MFS transporter [Thiotrichales bacterium 19S11-10]|nr:Bcr/CflA family efflux MFS transporter [Thiotrichales bacterium 19S11-10]